MFVRVLLGFRVRVWLGLEQSFLGSCQAVKGGVQAEFEYTSGRLLIYISLDMSNTVKGYVLITLNTLVCCTLQVVLKDVQPVELLHFHCTCKAGKALCNHGVALLFQAAHYSQLKLQVVPPTLSCTEGEQQWHKPRVMVSSFNPTSCIKHLSCIHCTCFKTILLATFCIYFLPYCCRG